VSGPPRRTTPAGAASAAGTASAAAGVRGPGGRVARVETDAPRTPARGGDLLAIPAEASRESDEAAVLAFVHGLHVMVVDGGNAFVGQSRLAGSRGEAGQVFDLGGGLSATLARAGEAWQLTFSNGTSVPMTQAVE